MFDIVRNNRRLVQVFLALITLPFAFWGVESYIHNAASGTEMATVGGIKITPAEFQQALQKQQDRLRASLGSGATPETLDTPEIRKNVLEGLINQHLLSLHAAHTGISVSDAQLFQIISTVPSLQENGQFSKQRYEAVVAAQGMTKQGFEARLRQDLTIQQMVGSIADASIAGEASANRWLSAMLEEREISVALISPESFAAQVKLDASEVRKYYEANKAAFSVPEQIKPEYVVLSQVALAEQANVSNDEIKAWYSAHADQYRQVEQRRASHILLALEKNAAADKVKAAEEKAASLLDRLRKAPSDFAVLAKQNSQDPGSAAKGGDLDWFGRGAMVKPFEDAAFALKEGELSGIVRSDFGLHIIKVTGIRPERQKPLDEVSSQIASELRIQSGAKKYVELAEGFSNTVYEQSDSLQPVADKLKLRIQQGDWLAKGGSGKPPFDNSKLTAALFSDDSVKNKRNTEAVEVAPGTLVAAHVAEYKPASLRSFEEVQADIEKKLIRDREVGLSRAEGERKLASLRKDESVALTWSPARSVPRIGASGFSPTDLKEIFRVDAGKLPAYAGIATGSAGYAIYRISKVVPYAGTNDPRSRLLTQQYARIVAGEDFRTWLTSLRKQYPVAINAKAFDSREH